LIKNIQVQTRHIFHEAFFSAIDGSAPHNFVCIGIKPNEELLFLAAAVINDVPQLPTWRWFVWIILKLS
jgi:hypothetical protein